MFKHNTPIFEEALAFAIIAIARGDLKLGNAALEWIIEREPSNTIILLWMACTISSEHGKRRYKKLIFL